MINDEIRWQFSCIDAYEPVSDDEEWSVCPICHVKPRKWCFDNGRYAKCLCSSMYGKPEAEAESIMSVYRRCNGKTAEYNYDELRINWNKRCEELNKNKGE